VIVMNVPWFREHLHLDVLFAHRQEIVQALGAYFPTPDDPFRQELVVGDFSNPSCASVRHASDTPT